MARQKKTEDVVVEPEVATYSNKEKLGGKTMATEKYLVANLVNVKEVFVGRGQSVEHTDEMPNGALVFLGDLKSGETHIRQAVTSGKAEVTNMPYVVAEPEIRPEQYTRMDNALGKFRLEADKPHVAWQLNLHDRIEYSQDFFTDTPAVGDVYELKYAAETFGTKNSGATGIVFKVVEVKESWLPNRLDAKGKLYPTAYKLYKLEVINKTA